MDRTQEMGNAAQIIENELFASQCRRLEQAYKKKDRRKEATKDFSALFHQATEMEKEVSWLGINYLHTSMKTRSYELAISLYTTEFIFDLFPIQMYWQPSLFFECFEEDLEIVMKELQRKYVRIRKYEEDFVQGICIEYYYAAIMQLLRDLEKDIIETEAFLNMRKSASFSAFYGRYCGEGDILWHISTI